MFLVQNGFARMRQDLVNAPTEHHVTTQEQANLGHGRVPIGAAPQPAAPGCLALIVARSGPYSPWADWGLIQVKAAKPFREPAQFSEESLIGDDTRHLVLSAELSPRVVRGHEV